MTARLSSPAEYARAAELFERVQGLPPDAREAAVRSVEGYSAAERDEALSLLRQAPGEAFLATPAETRAVMGRVMREVAADDPSRLIGTVVGAFKVESLAGFGGMGVVYRATDVRTGQGVALKVLRGQAMSESMVLRFQRESKVLARLQHPGIARVLEAGTVGDGSAHPYFAMELLEGASPITPWARDRGLDARGVLALMARVADAVHHGHQRGVIHRDLKPQNILVTPEGDPKLIDFGVASVTDADVSCVTVSTGTGVLVGTFAYMSPEQCEGDSASIDTRSDVYALGVVLYEMLAGTRPHELEGRPLAEVLRTIRRGASARLEAVRPELAGDVATIVHKAMDADPERRYASAADLSQDILRYLDHRPIEARPAGAWHRLGLMWRRQRVAVSASVLAGACVVGAGAVSVVSAAYARGEEAKAKAAWGQEAQARARAEHATMFLRGALGSANPYQPRHVTPALLASRADPWAEWMFCPWDFANPDGRKATVEDVLLAAGGKVRAEFADDPASEADLSETLGVTLYRMDRYEEARVLLERCLEIRLATLGEQDDATIRAMCRAGNVYDSVDGVQAVKWYARAHEACVAKWGAVDARTLRVQRMLGNAMHVRGTDGAAGMLRAVPMPSADTALPPEQLVHLATAAMMMSDRREPLAKTIAEEVLRRLEAGECAGDMAARVMARRSALRVMFDFAGDYRAYAAHIMTLRDEAAEVFGAWSPEYINVMSAPMLAGLERGAAEDAAVYFALATRAQHLLRGPEHWETRSAALRARDAIGLVDPGSPTAGACAREVLTATRELPQGVSTAGMIAECILAHGERAGGKPEAGLDRLRGVIARAGAPQAPRVYPHAWVRVQTEVGRCLADLGRVAEARRALEGALRLADEIDNATEAERWAAGARAVLDRLGP